MSCNHTWVHAGGRGCPKDPDANMGHGPIVGYVSRHSNEFVTCGQAVYRCSKCGIYDYGEPGGPGFEQCQNNCPLEIRRDD